MASDRLECPVGRLHVYFISCSLAEASPLPALGTRRERGHTLAVCVCVCFLQRRASIHRIRAVDAQHEMTLRLQRSVDPNQEDTIFTL